VAQQPTLAVQQPTVAVQQPTLAVQQPTIAVQPPESEGGSIGGGISSSLPISDDFSDPGSGWEIGSYETGDVGYENGRYFVTAVEEGSTMWGEYPGDFADVIIDIDTYQVQGPATDNNSYGVICRLIPGEDVYDTDGYSFQISGDGYYSIQAINDGEYEPLVEWETSDVILQGNAQNHIRASCIGSTLTLEVNGVQLAQVNDGSYASGGFGVKAATLEEGITRVEFDNFFVSQP
jgi:hypothetical protein